MNKNGEPTSNPSSSGVVVSSPKATICRLLPVHNEAPAQTAEPSSLIKKTPIWSPDDSGVVIEPGIITV